MFRATLYCVKVQLKLRAGVTQQPIFVKMELRLPSYRNDGFQSPEYGVKPSEYSCKLCSLNIS